MTEDIKEQIEEEVEEDKRSELNIQQFMNDMMLIGDQVKDRNLVKPVFQYGTLEVTNYLLWLMLAELMRLNDKQLGG